MHVMLISMCGMSCWIYVSLRVDVPERDFPRWKTPIDAVDARPMNEK